MIMLRNKDGTLEHSLYSLPLPVSGLGSSPAGEGGRPILLSVVVTHKQTCQFMFKGRWHETIFFATPKSRLSNSRCRDRRSEGCVKG